jgi:hypothetical protein
MMDTTGTANEVFHPIGISRLDEKVFVAPVLHVSVVTFF